jgi:hypothetical protein
MRRLLALAFVLLLLAGCGEDETTTREGGDPIDSVAGEWEGTLQQKDMPSFPIRVTIASASARDENVVSYGGTIDCSGTWRYVEKHGATVVFEEVIDSGEGGNCKGRGRVRVTPSGGDLEYQFRGGGVVSRGRLAPAS